MTESAGAADPIRCTIHIVSDATGGLARHIVNAVLTQFPELHREEHYHVFQRDSDRIKETLKRIREPDAMVFFAILDDALIEQLQEGCKERGIPCVDLTTHVANFVSDITGIPRARDLKLLHPTDGSYLQRIQAMEFTAQHDDSRRLETIDKADIVIVGLSRTCKSPVSTYLGSIGFKVANVSLAPETGVPEEVDRVPPGKIVAFTMQPKSMFEIRKRRFADFEPALEGHGYEGFGYYDLRSVIDEVMWVEEEFSNRKWPVLDTAGFTIEEIAAQVLRALKIKHQGRIHI